MNKFIRYLLLSLLYGFGLFICFCVFFFIALYYYDEATKVIYRVSVRNKSDFPISSLEITDKNGTIYADLSPLGIKGRKTYKFYPLEGLIAIKMRINRGFAPLNQTTESVVGGYLPSGGGGSSDIEIFNNKIELQRISIFYKGAEPSIYDKETIRFFSKI